MERGIWKDEGLVKEKRMVGDEVVVNVDVGDGVSVGEVVIEEVGKGDEVKETDCDVELEDALECAFPGCAFPGLSRAFLATADWNHDTIHAHRIQPRLYTRPVEYNHDDIQAQ